MPIRTMAQRSKNRSGELFILVETSMSPTNRVMHLRFTMVESGEYRGDITVPGPVHLLCVGDKLYVGCSGDKEAGSQIAPSVQCWDLTSRHLSAVVSDSSLASVSGIAFGADGNFYVADRTARTVRRYGPTSVPFISLGAFIKDGLPDEPEFLLYVDYAAAG